MKFLRIVLPITFFVSFIVLFVGRVSAQSDSIDATAKVNICGNGSVETPPEDCEGSDLNGESCQTQGYAEGDLACDISCEFDTSGCSGTLTPTSTPSPTPGPTSSSSSGSTSSSASGSQSVSDTITNAVVDLVQEVTEQLVDLLPGFPSSLNYLDLDGNGLIDLGEIDDSIATWISAWRGQSSEDCDLNADGACNIIDFSMLMYYIE